MGITETTVANRAKTVESWQTKVILGRRCAAPVLVRTIPACVARAATDFRVDPATRDAGLAHYDGPGFETQYDQHCIRRRHPSCRDNSTWVADDNRVQDTLGGLIGYAHLLNRFCESLLFAQPNFGLNLELH